MRGRQAGFAAIDRLQNDMTPLCRAFDRRLTFGGDAGFVPRLAIRCAQRHADHGQAWGEAFDCATLFDRGAAGGAWSEMAALHGFGYTAAGFSRAHQDGGDGLPGALRRKEPGEQQCRVRAGGCKDSFGQILGAAMHQ